MKNVIYYHDILKLGGTTTYEYELVKKYYKTKDIVIYYSYGDAEQIRRLRQYVKVVKWNGEDIECDNFITNYNFESFIPHVKLSGKGHTYQVIHAMYKTNRIKPKVFDFFDYYLCVSEIVRKEFKEVTGLSDEKLLVSHNPITIEEKDKIPCLIIGSFQRLRGAWEKGGNRMEQLIKRLDHTDINYLWLMATDDKPFHSNNVVYMNPRIDVLNIMATCDVVTVLSDCEGDNYTSKEAKMVGCKILSTPLDCLLENKIIGKNDKLLEYDLSNIDEVIEWLRALYKAKKPNKTDYIPPQDKYDEILLDGVSNYEREETFMKVKVLVNGIQDKDTGKTLPIGFIKEVDKDDEGIKKAIASGYIEVVEEPKVEVAIQEPKEVKKAVKKSTKKK